VYFVGENNGAVNVNEKLSHNVGRILVSHVVSHTTDGATRRISTTHDHRHVDVDDLSSLLHSANKSTA